MASINFPTWRLNLGFREDSWVSSEMSKERFAVRPSHSFASSTCRLNEGEEPSGISGIRREVQSSGVAHAISRHFLQTAPNLNMQKACDWNFLRLGNMDNLCDWNSDSSLRLGERSRQKLKMRRTTSFGISRMKELCWKLISEIKDPCAALRLRSVFSTSWIWAWSVANLLQGLHRPWPSSTEQDSVNSSTSGFGLKALRTPHSSHRSSAILRGSRWWSMVSYQVTRDAFTHVMRHVMSWPDRPATWRETFPSSLEALDKLSRATRLHCLSNYAITAPGGSRSCPLGNWPTWNMRLKFISAQHRPVFLQAATDVYLPHQQSFI